MTLRNRVDAGRRLVPLLAAYRGADPVVLALPRGGVPVAAEIARSLGCPLDLLLVRKIGVPGQPELAMGAVIDGADPITVRNDEVIAMCAIARQISSRPATANWPRSSGGIATIWATVPPCPLAGKTAIVVDDGVATGATTRVALKAVRRREPRAVVLAVPVGPTSTLRRLADLADEVVAVERHEPFAALGCFYDDFSQLDDADVTSLLAQFPPA